MLTLKYYPGSGLFYCTYWWVFFLKLSILTTLCSNKMSSYRIIVCREGFCSQVDNNLLSAACTITLIIGPLNILFDPGSPCDGMLITSTLSKHDLKTDDIDYVICSHGHIDHVGNLVEFPRATIIVGNEIMKDGMFERIPINHDNPYVIDDNVCHCVQPKIFLRYASFSLPDIRTRTLPPL